MYDSINSQGVDNDRLFNVRCFEYKSFIVNTLRVYRIVHKALVLETSYIEQTVIVNTLRVYFKYRSFMYDPINSQGVDSDRLFNVGCFEYKSFMYDPINSQGVDTDPPCEFIGSYIKLLYSKHPTLNRWSLSTP
jgi:hypothetical protein